MTGSGRILAAMLAALALFAATGGSAASQETTAGPDAAGTSAVELIIAVAPSPPVVGEEVMLISRFLGSEATFTVERGWNFEWSIDGSGPASPLTNEPRQLIRFPTADTYEVELTACPEDGSKPCFDASTEVTVTEVGTRPGSIELDVVPSAMAGDTFTATVTSVDHKILGTYFETRSRSRQDPVSPPGNSPSFDFERPDAGRFVVVTAACYLAPGLICQTAQHTIQSAESSANDANPSMDDPTSNDDPIDSKILIAPFPPVVGETVVFAVRGDESEEPSAATTWTLDHFSENDTRKLASGTTRLTRAGTHTISITQCDDGCRVVAQRIFEVAAINSRPTVDLDLIVAPEAVVRDEPVSVTIQAGKGATIGETFVQPSRFQRSEIASTRTYVATPETAGLARVTAAVCSAGIAPTCELITHDFFVNRPGIGTVDAPAAVTSPAIDVGLFSGGRRLRWTDTNELETGYRVSAGSTLEQLTPLGDYPRDTSGVFTADESHDCFAVQVLFDDTLGPSTSYCRPEPTAEGEPYMILTLGEPIAGEPVTFRVIGMAQKFGYWRNFYGALPQWDFGGRPVDPSCATQASCTHTFESPGVYDVAVSDDEGALVKRMVTVVSSPSEDRFELRAPDSVESFAQTGYATFSDTNTSEDGYAVSYANGSWLAHTAADETLAELSHSFSEYNGGPDCIEVRAFKDGVVGPAASSCNFSPGNHGHTFNVTEVTSHPGSNPGELVIGYSASVGTNMAFLHQIAAIDPKLTFVDTGDGTAKPRCHLIGKSTEGSFDYEMGVPGVGLVRRYIVTIDGLTTGRSYHVGFAHQADYNGGTHSYTWRATRACQPHNRSPEVIAP